MTSRARPPRRSIDELFTPTQPVGVEDLADAKLVDVGLLDPNPFQPRRRLDDGALDELARDIAEHGVLQPLLARPHPTAGGRYQIAVGERRWRAAQKAAVGRVPLIEREMDDTSMERIALAENIQRADLDPIDEAHAYKRLMDRFGFSLRDLAAGVHKHHEYIAQRLRLIEDPSIEARVRAGKIGPTVAQELVRVKDPARREDLLERADRGARLTVQDVKAAAVRSTRPEPEVSNNSTETPHGDGATLPVMQEHAPASSPSADIATSHGLRQSGDASAASRETELVNAASLAVLRLMTERQGAAPRAAVLQALREDVARLEKEKG